MTIALANSNPVQYAGNGTAVTFTYPWKIFASTDLVVGFIVSGVYTQQTSGYTVAGVGLNGGGSITFATAPPLGTTVDLRPLTPEIQPTEFANLASYLPENTTNACDRITRFVQDQTRLGYTFSILGLDQELIPWLPIPGPTVRANSSLGFDANGMPTTMPIVAGALSQPAFNALLAASTPYIQTPAELAALITPTNLSIPPLPIDPRRYGAIGNGLVDDHVAVQTAFTLAGSAGGEVVFPPGYTFLCNADITVPTAATFGAPCASMRGQGWATYAVIFGTGSTFGFVYLGGGATTGGTTSSNYYYAGTIFNLAVKMQGTSNTAFFYNSVNQPKMDKVWVAGSSGQGRAAYFLNVLLPAFTDCLITGMGSATQWSVEFDSCTTASWLGSRISAGVATKGGLAIDRCTNFAGNCVAIESCGTPISIGAKTESSLACTGITLDGLELENPGNNPYIDIGAGLSGSALVLNTHIRGLYGSPSGTPTVPFAVRIQNASGVTCENHHYTLGASPTSCYEIVGTNVSGLHVTPHRNLQSLGVPWMRFNGSQIFSWGPQLDCVLGPLQNGKPMCQHRGLIASGSAAALSGATPSILISATMGGYYGYIGMTNGGATTVTQLSGGEPGMEIDVEFNDSNTTLTNGNSGGAFRNRTGANETASAGQIRHYRNNGGNGVFGSLWVETH